MLKEVFLAGPDVDDTYWQWRNSLKKMKYLCAFVSTLDVCIQVANVLFLAKEQVAPSCVYLNFYICVFAIGCAHGSST